MKKLKRDLLLFVLAFLFCFPALAGDTYLDVTSEFLTEQQNSSNSSENSKKNTEKLSSSVSNSSSNSEKLEIQSMDAFQLLDNLEQTLISLQNKLQMLSITSKNLEADLLNVRTELMSCQNSLSQCKQALISNNEDLTIIVKEVGNLVEKVKQLEERNKRGSIISEINTPLSFVFGVAFGTGLYMVCSNKENGKYPLVIGGVGFISLEITYNIGRVFKWW